jgi:DNA-binding NarL/FixJ family response regulator
MTIKVLLIDDHQLFLAGLKDILSHETDLEILGTGNSGLEAVELARELDPHVIVMDVTMPDLNGIKATRKILETNPDIRILALSMHANKRFISEMLVSGAKGYMLKESNREDFLQAIRTVASGEVFLSPHVASIVVEEYSRLLNSSGHTALPELSSREMEVLKLLVDGYNTKAIASELNISKNTVDTHRRRILDKLDCQNIAELTRLALREGLVGLEE